MTGEEREERGEEKSGVERREEERGEEKKWSVEEGRRRGGEKLTEEKVSVGSIKTNLLK